MTGMLRLHPNSITQLLCNDINYMVLGLFRTFGNNLACNVLFPRNWF